MLRLWHTRAPNRLLATACLAGVMLVASPLAWCQTEDQFSITLSSSTPARYGKLEIVCDGITTSYANPLDPDEVNVEGHFTDPDGAEEVAYGFWYQDYARSRSGVSEVLTPQGSAHWLVRYAPKKVGDYTCHVTVTDSGGTVQSETENFTVTSSDNKGFLGVSETNPHYFEHDNGEGFFGIGLDICTDLTPTAETYQYDLYLDELEAHGANLFRFWFLNSEIESATPYGHWAWSLQDSQLGADYDMEDAWRLDYLLDQSAEKGIYILVTTMDFSRFMAAEWENDLHNSANGGPCDDPWDVWTDELPKQYYKRLLRYFAARWGYSTSVLAWEFWNEWHELEWHTSQYNVTEGIAWHQEMGAYLQSADLNHMVTTSMGSFDAYDGLWNLEDMDFAQMHGYYYNQARYPWDWWVHTAGKDMFQFIPHFADNAMHYGKPVLFGEFGITGAPGQQDELTIQDEDAVYLHNGMWSGLMYGLAGTPMAWRWHLFPSRPAWWDHFLGLSNFVDDISFNNSSFVTMGSGDDQLLNPGFEDGTTNWQLWPNDGALTIDTAVQYSGERSLKYQSSGGTSYQINKHHYDTGFDLLPNRQYRFSAQVRTEDISSAYIVVSFGHQSSTLNGTNGWTQLVIDFTTPSSVSSYYVGARVSGSGTAWFDDFQMRLADNMDLSHANLRAMGLKGNDEAYIWVQNSEHTWYNVVMEEITPTLIPAGETATILGLAVGDYSVQWWDTYAGVVTGTASASTDGIGNLTVVLPAIQKDVACKIRLSGGGGEDTTPPTTPVISTPQQVVNAVTFAVELGTPSMDVNFSHYQVRGGQYAAWTNTGDTGPFTFTLVQNAVNTLRVRGLDSSGNISAADSVDITEDSVLPTTPVIATPNQVTVADSIVVTLSTSSTDANFSNYQLRGGQYASWTDVAETDNFTFNLVENAENVLQVRGEDAASNASAAASVTIMQDSQPPIDPAEEPVHID